jgi:hypothetical protein
MSYFPGRGGIAIHDQANLQLGPQANQGAITSTGIPKSVGSSPGSPAPQVDMSTPGDYRTQAEKDKVKLLEDQRQLQFDKQRRAFEQDRKAFDTQGDTPAPAPPVAGPEGGVGAPGAPGAAPGPAIQALERAMEQSPENWEAIATPSTIRPGLGDRLPVQRQSLFSGGGAIY